MNPLVENTVVNSDTGKVVVVGGGHAAGTVVAALRQAGFAGGITLLGAEPHYPYHRPPLSKKLTAAESIKSLRDEAFYAEQDITVVTHERVVSIDRVAQTVETATGRKEEYDVLIIATGSRPRALPIPGAHLPEVLSLRSFDDAQRLRDAIRGGGPLVIIGAGYIGLEVAASARSEGVEVTVIERADRALARVASPHFAELIEAQHRARGITLIVSADVSEITGRDGHVDAVKLGDGTVIPCGTVLIGIGTVPESDFATAAGLRIAAGGIAVNENSQSDDPKIYAIGDVASRVQGGAETVVRFESIPSAIEQSMRVVAHLMGQEPPVPEVPWFWSDQLDLKLKIAGVLPAEFTTELHGDPSQGKFALLHYSNGKLAAVESSNSPGEFMAARKVLADANSLSVSLSSGANSI